MDKHEFTYTTPAGSPPVTADVYYPTSPSPTPRPIALLFHPGAFVLSNKDLVSKGVIECIVAELGAVAVVANYRLCPAVSVWDGPVADAKACLAWARADLPALLQAHAAGVSLDTNRIASIGFSAGGTLALLLAGETAPPRACLTFYGQLYWPDPYWRQPKAALAGLPALDPNFYNQIRDEGVLVTAPSTRGPAGPDLSRPRNAWLLSAIKEGWWLDAVVPDGDLQRIDPSRLFGPAFPPTAFVHGTADVVCPLAMSERAHGELKAHGVDTELFTVEGKPHDFDAGMGRHDEDFGRVRDALVWLGRQLAV